MTSHRLSLVATGAVAIGFIAFAGSLRPDQQTPLPAMLALLLAAYAVGIGLGRLAFGRKG